MIKWQHKLNAIVSVTLSILKFKFNVMLNAFRKAMLYFNGSVFRFMIINVGFPDYLIVSSKFI